MKVEEELILLDPDTQVVVLLLDTTEDVLKQLIPLRVVHHYHVLEDILEVDRVQPKEDQPIRVRTNPRGDHRILLRDNDQRYHTTEYQVTPIKDKLCQQRIELVCLYLRDHIVEHYQHIVVQLVALLIGQLRHVLLVVLIHELCQVDHFILLLCCTWTTTLARYLCDRFTLEKVLVEETLLILKHVGHGCSLLLRSRLIDLHRDLITELSRDLLTIELLYQTHLLET